MNHSIPRLRHLTPRRRRAYQPQAEGLEGRQLLSAGVLDTTFGVSGPGYTLAGAEGGRMVQLQSDGKILAAGGPAGDTDFRLVRLSPSGDLDPTFGTSGSVTTDFAGGSDMAHDMAILPDGRIVVVGNVDNFYTLPGKGGKPVTHTNRDFGLACYLAADTTISGVLYKAGALDPRFGTVGEVMTNISTTNGVKSTDSPTGVIVQEDGKIVVGGLTPNSSGTNDAVLVRYNTNGSIDNSFGSGGIVQTHLDGYTFNGVWDLALLRDPINSANDKIVTMEAPSNSSVMLARYNLDGSFDTTFNTTGRSTITTLAGHTLGDWEMALQPDGSAVVTGWDQATNSYGSFLLRYTNTGQLDTNFGTSGSGIILFGAATGDTAYSVAIQSNGRIIVAGGSDTIPGSFVARFDTSGAIDTTFGALGTGYARDNFTNVGSGFSHNHSLILQPNGQIVVVGTGTTRIDRKTTRRDFLIVRYQGDPVAALSAASAVISGAPSIGPSAATGSRSRMSVAVRYHPLSAETHEPGRWQASGQAELGLTPLQLEPVTPSLPTARLAVGLSKRLRPTQWLPSYLGLE